MKTANKTKEEFIKVIEEVEALSQHAAEMEKLRADQKRIELVAQEAREYAESIVDTVRKSLVVLDADLRVSSANRSFYQTFKVTARETEGQFIYELGNHQWDIPELRELLEDILPKNTTFDDFEVEHIFPNIGRRTMLLNARRIHRETGNTCMLLLGIEDITECKQVGEKSKIHRKRLEELVAERTAEIRTANEQLQREITERKQAEEKIKQAAEEWRATFDSITDLVSIHDKNFRLVRVNKALANSLKMEPAELIGKTCYQLVHGTNESVPNCPHVETLATKKPVTVEFFEPRLGVYLQVSTSPMFDTKGEVVACVHIAKDITERKRMEEQLIITDRLVSIGELAAGIAHELNNPLTSVIGFSQLLLDGKVAGNVKKDLKVISSEAQRAAEVVKNLLTFAGKHSSVKQPVNINNIIDKVLELRAYEQRVSNIRVITRFAPDLPEVVADYFQLQQVFLNIILNAEHFMIETHKRGTLTITTESTGSIIKASFADDGPGIPKENLGHLFDPFFTTKEVGKGTGLGLSICHGIITEHGGRIQAESELGKGAIFIMELPISGY